MSIRQQPVDQMGAEKAGSPSHQDPLSTIIPSCHPGLPCCKKSQSS
jgi:hypothetical protein